MITLRQYLAEKVAAFNIGRSSMPQIKDQEVFKLHLTKMGITYGYNTIGLDMVNPIQVDIDQAKVRFIDPYMVGRPIIISNAYYILDGHHRYYAHVMADDIDEIETLQVDLGINQLLSVANDFIESGEGGDGGGE